MATKAERELIATLQAQIAAMSHGSTPQVNESLTFTIPQSVADAAVDALVNATDDKGRASTFMAGLRTFAAALPASLQNKPLPDVEVSRLVDAAVAKYRAAYGSEPVNEESIKPRKSKAKKLFTCAPLLPMAFDQGIGGTVDNITKFCTVLQNEKFVLPAAVLKFKAPKVEAPVNHAAEIAKHLAAILAMVSPIDALSATAKAQLVNWADLHQIKGVKDADTHRNPALLG